MVRWIYSHFSLPILINEASLALTINCSSLINYSKKESLPLWNVNRVTCSIYHLHKSVYYVNAFIYWIYSWTIYHINFIIEFFRRQSLMVLLSLFTLFRKRNFQCNIVMITDTLEIFFLLMLNVSQSILWFKFKRKWILFL